MSITTTTLRRRAEKINSEQKKIILQFIACTPEIISTTVTPEFSLHHHQLFWENLSIILNLFGPPRKSPDLWKKAWKDYRCRFRKNNVDIGEALHYVKTENPVDTHLLLCNAEKLKNNDDKLELRRAVWDLIINCLPEIVITNINEHTFIQSTDADIDNECSMSNDGEFPESPDMKIESADEPSTESIILAVEEITSADSYSENDKHIDSIESINTKTKLDNINNLDDNCEIELAVEESTDFPFTKKPKLSASLSTLITEHISAESSRTSQAKGKEFPKNGMKKGVLDELLIEMRKFNKIQTEKLALKRSYIEYKKSMLKNSYITQKEIAKSQNLLAASVKTFIDNISFNT